MKPTLRTVAALACGAWAGIATAQAAPSADDLAGGFAQPPASARPWVYWFPLDGNLSSNGITLDLEAMKRVGIGGVLYMETDQGAPRGPAKFAGPLWRDLFKHICVEASRLGLEVNMNNDAGWCGSGGPWIGPELSMQRVVWTQTNVAGPQRFAGALPQPAAVRDFYRDIALFAFPTPGQPYAIPHLAGKSSATKEEIPLRAAYPALAPEAVTPRGRLLDLTAQLTADGRLAWDVPPGPWTILRLGHTTTGKDNHPAPIDGRGLECDKLSKTAAEAMFQGLMAKLIADNRKFAGAGRTLVSTHIDSWEVGSQNWTPKFREEFKRLRGYDPWLYLPVMCGVVMDSLEVSERFLWDVRQTVNDLLLENYAGHFRTLAQREGLRLSIEAYDGVPADDMAYAGRADEPMGEFWSYAPYSGSQWCTEMASAAHIYGKRVLGAEAFTATDAEKWRAHPGAIKAMGDWAFCEGINRFVFHRYALQPWTDARPGMSMGPWGLHYERTQTWWEQSKAWHEYLARCQFLLQQGLFVADLCFLAPEMTPQRFKSPLKSGLDRPGYNFDGCPPEALLTRMRVRDGRLVLPDGMSYRVLVLPKVSAMTPALLRKVRELVAAGATVVGGPPVKSPSLSGYPRCDNEVRALAEELWGSAPAPAVPTERRFGRGRIVWGGDFRSPEETDPELASGLGSAKWIWSAEGNPAVAAPPGRRHFRRLIVVPAGSSIASARWVLTADNTFECWMNGKRLGGGEDFNRTFDLDASSALKPGTNVLAVAAVNLTANPNPAGLIGRLHIVYAGGGTQDVATGADWQAALEVSDDWTSNARAAGAWAAVLELGPPGMAPWGNIETVLAAADPIPDIDAVCRWLAGTGLRPDFASQTAGGSQALRYIHKRIGDTELYFVANKNPQPEQALCAFRVQGRQPELWRPETGRTEKPAVYHQSGDVTRVPIRFEPHGSVFVVFRRGSGGGTGGLGSVSRNGVALVDVAWAPEGTATDKKANAALLGAWPAIDLTRGPRGALQAQVWQPGSYVIRTAKGASQTLDVAPLPPVVEVGGAWEVRFDPKWGGPASIGFDRLEDWARRPEEGVRHYSGSAVYRKVFSFSADHAHDSQCGWFLDLGRVAVMAEIKLNGRDLGILWKPPFRVEVTQALRPGENDLEVKVVNLWINRQIGDEELPEDSSRNPDGTLKEWPQWLGEGKPSPTGRHTFTSWRLWKKGDPLAESGLLGPVTLRPAARLQVSPRPAGSKRGSS